MTLSGSLVTSPQMLILSLVKWVIPAWGSSSSIPTARADFGDLTEDAT